MSFFSGGSTTSDSYSGLRGISGIDLSGFGNQATSNMTNGSNAFNRMLNNPYAFPQLDQNGLFPQQTNSVNSLLSQALGQFSASGGARGQLSPENQSAVASSTLQNILPQLMTLTNNNLTNAYQMPITNQQNAGGLFNNFVGQYNPLLGSQTNNKTTAPGIGYNFANQLGTNLAGWAGPSAYSSGKGGQSGAAGFSQMFM